MRVDSEYTHLICMRFQEKYFLQMIEEDEGAPTSANRPVFVRCVSTHFPKDPICKIGKNKDKAQMVSKSRAQRRSCHARLLLLQNIL